MAERRFHFRYKPDAEHTFWLYSPEGDGLTFWATAEERDEYAKQEIRTYVDENTWFEEVEGVIAGTVTHIAKAVNIHRPIGSIDEDGYDESGNGPWEDKDCIKCDYELSPL